jgi:hypothetical protein
MGRRAGLERIIADIVNAVLGVSVRCHASFSGAGRTPVQPDPREKEPT